MSNYEYQPKPKTGIIIGGAVAIVAMVLVFFLVAGPGPEHKVCYSYNEPRAGKFGLVVNDQVVAYADTKAEADKLLASYKECQGK